MKKSFVVYGCGSLSALLVNLLGWLLMHYGFSYNLGSLLSPSLMAAGLYPKLVWGGVAGFLLLLPLSGGRWLMRALIVALIAAVVILFVVYPLITGYGVAGLALGLWAPIIVFFVCLSWAMIAMLLYRLS